MWRANTGPADAFNASRKADPRTSGRVTSPFTRAPLVDASFGYSTQPLGYPARTHSIAFLGNHCLLWSVVCNTTRERAEYMPVSHR
jgi:hypothetical protein